MDKIFDAIEATVGKITDPDRLEKLLELAVRLAELYVRIKAIK